MRAVSSSFVFLFLFLRGTSYADSSFDAAVYIVTQHAFDDNPSRYGGTFVQDAMEYIQAQAWPDAHDTGIGCEAGWYIHGSQATKQITFVPGSLSFAIGQSEVTVDAVFDLAVDAPSFYRPCDQVLYSCFCDTVCSGSITLTTTITTSTVFDVYWNPQTAQISITPQLTLNVAQPAIGGCSVPSWGTWWVPVNQLIQDAIDQAIDDVVADLTSTYNVPQTFSPYSNVFVTYKVTGLTFTAGEMIITSASATMTAQTSTPNGPVNVVFDPATDDAHTPPPDTWSLVNPSDSSEILLNGLRLSSTILTGLMWAADVTGAVVVTQNLTVLDAHLVFNLDWAAPYMCVPSTDDIYTKFSGGGVNATCETVGSGAGAIMLEAIFSGFSGQAMLNYSGGSDPGFFIQVNSFNTSELTITLVEPRTPLPTNVIASVVRTMITHLISILNQYMATHPFLLPDNIAPYIPHPSIHLYNQPGCCNGTHGYIDMLTYCVCERTDPFWPTCQYQCSSEAVDSHTLRALDSNSFLVEEDFAISAANNSTGMYLLTYSTEDCSLGNPGDNLELVFLPAVSACAALPGSGNTYYYLTGSGSSLTFLYNCVDSACTASNCSLAGTNIQSQICTAASPSSYILLASDYACLGPGELYTQNGNYTDGYAFWASYQGAGAASCDASIQSLSSSVTLTNLGPLGTCSLDDSDAYNEAVLLPSNQDLYDISMQCPNSSCSSSCGLTYRSIARKQCIQWAQESETAGRLLSGTDLSECGTLPHSANIWLIVGVVLGTVIVCFGVSLALFFAVRKKKKVTYVAMSNFRRIHPVVKSWFEPKALPVRAKDRTVRAIRSFVFGIPKFFGWRRPSIEERPRMIAISLVIGAQVGYCFVWFQQNPFALFGQTTISALGLPAGVIDSRQMETVFGSWQVLGLWTSVGQLAVAVLLFVSRFGIKYWDHTMWLGVSALGLALIALSNFLLFVGPPFVFHFSDCVSLANASNGSQFLNSPDVRNTINEVLGDSFTGITLSYMFNFYLFFVHGMTSAVYATSIYYLFMSPYKWGSDLGRECLSRMRVAVLVMILCAPLTSTLPVIVIYQSLGVSYAWMAVWITIWVVPFPLFLHMQFLMKRITRWRPRQARMHAVFNAMLYVLALGTLTGMAFLIQAQERNVDTSFPVTLYIVTFVNVSALIFLLLEKMMARADGYLTLATALVPSEENIDKNIQSSRRKEKDKNWFKFLKKARSSGLRSFLRSPGTPFRLLGLWLLESKEQKNPRVYGVRVHLRRIAIILGFISYSYIVYQALHENITTTVKQELVDFLQTVHIQLTWPDAAHGGTIFDDAFSLFNDARWWSTGCQLTAWTCFLLALIMDIFRKHIHASRICGFLGLPVLFGAVLAPAIPNYLSATHVYDIVPYCAPKFNNMVGLITGDIMGVFCAGIFTLAMLPILLAVTPALVRASIFVLMTYVESGRQSDRNVTTLRIVSTASSCMTPVVTVLPLLVFYQMLGDWVVGMILGIFFLIPTVLGFVFLFAKRQVTIYAVYISWMVVYIGCIIALGLYYVFKFDMTQALVNALQDIDSYCEAIAEDIDTSRNYLLSWLSVFGALVGIPVPLDWFT